MSINPLHKAHFNCAEKWGCPSAPEPQRAEPHRRVQRFSVWFNCTKQGWCKCDFGDPFNSMPFQWLNKARGKILHGSRHTQFMQIVQNSKSYSIWWCSARSKPFLCGDNATLHTINLRDHKDTFMDNQWLDELVPFPSRAVLTRDDTCARWIPT